MSTAKLLLNNTVAQGLAKMVTVASTLIISRLIANPDQGLGRQGYAEFGIVMAYAAYFYIICDFGLNAIATKDITEDQDKTSTYLSNLLSLRLVSAIILVGIGLATLAFISVYSTTIKVGILVSLITIASQAVITNNNILFQVKLQYWLATLAVVIGSLTSLSLAIIVYLLGWPLFWYVVSVTIGSIVMAITSTWLVRWQVPIRLRFDWPLWRHLVVSAWPLGAAIILNLLYIRSGFFILSLHDVIGYGLLNAAYRIFDVALVLPVFAVNALYPIMVKRAQQGSQQFFKLVAKSLAFIFALSLLVAATLWLLSPLAIDLSVNNIQFNPSIDILRLLAMIVPIFFISNVLLWATITLNLRKSILLFYGLGAIMSLSLNLWLIPIYGYWALIAITAIVEAVITLLLAIQLWLYYSNKTKIKGLPQASQQQSIPVSPEDQISESIGVSA